MWGRTKYFLCAHAAETIGDVVNPHNQKRTAHCLDIRMFSEDKYWFGIC